MRTIIDIISIIISSSNTHNYITNYEHSNYNDNDASHTIK